MLEKTVTPKFLTEATARLALDIVLGAFKQTPLSTLVKRQACHIVILVPSMKDDREANFPDWPNYAITPQVLLEHSLGDRAEWSAEYDNIARCKALQLWHERNDDRTDIMPHLLFPGDTPYWGGVRRHGIVVACSGVQPYFDKMIAGMIADTLVGLAYHFWMTSEDKKNDVDWLT